MDEANGGEKRKEGRVTERRIERGKRGEKRLEII
jgi:hypothetical protein